MLEFARRRLDTYPTPQQFSDSFINIVKMGIRSQLIFINEFFFEKKESKKNRKQIFTMKDKFDGEVLLLGSGPSLNNLDIEQIKLFKERGGYLAATNTLLLSPKFQELEIDFYFIIDPGLWSEKSFIERFNYLIHKGCFKGYLIQPASKDNLIVNYKKISYIDTRISIRQKRRNFQPNKRTSFHYSVALSAIYTLKYYGFTRILFAGLDSNLSKFFTVLPNNKIRFIRDGYYADENFNIDRSVPVGSKDLVDPPEIPFVRDMRDILYADAFLLNDLRKISENCINVGHDKSNDVCPRASLLYPVNSFPVSSQNNTHS